MKISNIVSSIRIHASSQNTRTIYLNSGELKRLGQSTLLCKFNLEHVFACLSHFIPLEKNTCPKTRIRTTQRITFTINFKHV